MLQNFYQEFGFFGALAISAVCFFLFIFWVAGVAGIALPEDGGKVKDNKFEVLLALLVPVYPIGWLFVDMYKQRKLLQQDDNSDSNA